MPFFDLEGYIGAFLDIFLKILSAVHNWHWDANNYLLVTIFCSCHRPLHLFLFYHIDYFLYFQVQTTLRLKINSLKTSKSIHRYTANILSTRSRTSIQPGSSAAYNVIEKSPQTSVLSKCSVDEQETCISLMDSAV